MLTIGDLREILDGLSEDVPDDTEVRIMDCNGELMDTDDVIVAPVVFYSSYEGYTVDKEDYEWEDDDSVYDEDIADSVPSVVICSL